MHLRSFVAAAIVLFTRIGAHADLLGDKLHVIYDYPNAISPEYDFGSITVPGAGAIGLSVPSFVLSPTQIVLTKQQPQDFLATAFNGYQFIDTSRDPGITAVKVDPASTLTGAVITSTSNYIAVNFAGVQGPAGETLILDLSFAAATPPSPAVAPEPASIALLSTGLVGVAGAMRKRSVQQASAQ